MLIVECARGYSAQLGRFDVFDWRDEHWTWVLAVGIPYGWTAKGTVYSAYPPRRPRGRWPEEKQDYQPQDWGSSKVFLREDACALAKALESALPDIKLGTIDLRSSQPSMTIFSDNMAPEAFDTLNSGVKPAMIENFIQFLQRGEFQFAYDD